jgi:hypothetical protein
MKFNKWTVGLAAIGVVSLASAARADEAKMSQVQTALSNTTISGYVSASFNWAMSPGENGYQNSPAAGIPYQGGKQDGFNLDVVKLSISKPQDESPWAAGYQVDLIFGPDAVNYNTSANAKGSYVNYYGNEYGTYPDFAIKQAYVALQTPVGNGINWKVGVFDSPIGYESFDAGNDPNYTRSWGNAIEPTELTGVLASYKFCDEFSLSAGIANTLMAGINTRAYPADSYNGDQSKDWHKAFLASATFTTPSSWGWAAGSSLYAGIVYGFNGQDNNGSGYHQGGDQINYYAGATLNTPVKQLTLGAAFDYAQNYGGGYSYYYNNGEGYYYTESGHGDVLAAGLYATVKATDKLSFNARAEYVYGKYRYSETGYDEGAYSYADHYSADGFELTGTVEYDLWVNVISRLELRWDHANINYSPLGMNSEGSYLDHKNAVGFYANVIYKF